MKTKIDEIEFIPVKPKNGLIGFVSFVLDEKLYCGSIGVHTRPQGGIRLVWPKVGNNGKTFPAMHPINEALNMLAENMVAEKIEKIIYL